MSAFKKVHGAFADFSTEVRENKDKDLRPNEWMARFVGGIAVGFTVGGLWLAGSAATETAREVYRLGSGELSIDAAAAGRLVDDGADMVYNAGIIYLGAELMTVSAAFAATGRSKQEHEDYQDNPAAEAA